MQELQPLAKIAMWEPAAMLRNPGLKCADMGVFEELQSLDKTAI